MPKKLTQDQFIERAKNIHGDKYDYSKTIYTGYNSKIIIICKKHGEFSQLPSNHLNGNDCIKCSTAYMPTNEEFIEKANRIHNYKYDYSKTIYKATREKIIIICKEHGEFEQTANSHLRGSGCRKCAGQTITNTSEFIERANKIHNYKYNYDETIYIEARKKVIITCPIHGNFEQTPTIHLKPGNCIKCVGQYSPTTEEFIEKAKAVQTFREYDYSKTIYVHAHAKVIIICPKHGEFEQTPSAHLKGQGCRKCRNYKNERLVEKFLIDKNISYISQYKILINIKKIYVDFYIPELNLFIEYNGGQHYYPGKFGNMTLEQSEINFIKQQDRDLLLKKYCHEHKINLLEIDGRVYKNKILVDYLNLINFSQYKKVA